MIQLLDKLFAAHPRSVGETYPQHFAVAWRFGAAMILGGLAALVHGLFPTLFERTASGAVKRLYSQMVSRQPTLARPAYEEAEWQLEYEI